MYTVFGLKYQLFIIKQLKLKIQTQLLVIVVVGAVP